MKLFKVGGAVRDEILGIPSKDMDFAVEAPSFEAMRDGVLAMGGTIFVENPEFLTIRAKVPAFGAADFVLARKDGEYSDGRRPDSVTPGTIFDDLARRDFTMNAIAVDMQTGKTIDPFNGVRAINNRIIIAVGSAENRLTEDPLRMIRAIRFSITKGMSIDQAIRNVINNRSSINLLRGVSRERIGDEVDRMFSSDTLASLRILEEFPALRDEMFMEIRLKSDMRP